MQSQTTARPGPREVADAARRARQVVGAVLSPAAARGSSEEWAAALGELRALADVVEAAEAEAAVRLAAIEPLVLETGELVETHRAPGHVSLDAPSIVSGVLGMTAVHAERWVHVVTVVPDGAPDAEVRPAGVDVATRPTDLVTVHGAAPGEPVLVARDWLERAVAATSSRTDHLGRVVVDPSSGALLSVDDSGTDGYRPGAVLARLVRARDGRCRFPGCHVAARFCDVDHVVPWPVGATTARNLVCLCRRHHRTKQRPGWSVVLHPDATTTWVDPTGRRRATHPLDHRPVVLPDTGSDADSPPRPPGSALSDPPHAVLEHLLEHGGPPQPARGCRVEIHRPRGRPVGPIVVELAPHHRRRRPTPAASPPF